MDANHDLSKIYRLSEILDIYNVSKPTIYRWVKEGKFPAPVSLGGPGTRAKGWLGTTLVEHQRSLTTER